MRIASDSCLRLPLQLSLLILIVNSVPVNWKPKRANKLMQWTNKHGKDGASASRNRSTTTDNSSYGRTTERLQTRNHKNVHPYDSFESREDFKVPPTQNGTLVRWLPSTMAEGETGRLRNFTGLEFCGGRLPVTRICDPAGILSIEEGKLFWHFLSFFVSAKERTKTSLLLYI